MWIYASSRRTQTTRRHSTMHRPTVPALWMWIRIHDRKFPKEHHKLQPWCWRTWKRKFSSSVFFSALYSLQSTRKSAIDKVYETDMNKQYVEYVRASARSEKKRKKRKLNFAIDIGFFNQISSKTKFRREKNDYANAFTYMRFPALAAIRSNSAKETDTAIWALNCIRHSRPIYVRRTKRYRKNATAKNLYVNYCCRSWVNRINLIV